MHSTSSSPACAMHHMQWWQKQGHMRDRIMEGLLQMKCCATMAEPGGDHTVVV